MRPGLASDALLATVGVLAAALPVQAAPPAPVTQQPPAAEQNVLWRTFYQTATYQTLSSLDDFAFGYFLGGGAAAGGLLVLANAASETAVNYVHDLIWAVTGRDNGQSASDTRMTRTATYTAANATRVFGLGYMLTGDPLLSVGYVAFNAAADAGVYAANDAAWDAYSPADRPAPGSPTRAETPWLASYWPNVGVTIREVPAENRMTIQAVPSKDGRLFRVVYVPANNPLERP